MHLWDHLLPWECLRHLPLRPLPRVSLAQCRSRHRRQLLRYPILLRNITYVIHLKKEYSGMAEMQFLVGSFALGEIRCNCLEGIDSYCPCKNPSWSIKSSELQPIVQLYIWLLMDYLLTVSFSLILWSNSISTFRFTAECRNSRKDCTGTSHQQWWAEQIGTWTTVRTKFVHWHTERCNCTRGHISTSMLQLSHMNCLFCSGICFVPMNFFLLNILMRL